MKKQVFGIVPIWVLATILGASLVFASTCIWSHSFTTMVRGSVVTVEVMKEFDESLYPGQNTEALFVIHNTGNTPLNVTVTYPEVTLLWTRVFVVFSYFDPLYLINSTEIPSDNGAATFVLWTDEIVKPLGQSSYVKVWIQLRVSELAPLGEVTVPVYVFVGNIETEFSEIIETELSEIVGEINDVLKPVEP